MKKPAASISVGERVKRQRKAVGLSQGKLGQQIGLDQAAVSKIEADKYNLSAARAYNLMRVLGMLPKDLFR